MRYNIYRAVYRIVPDRYGKWVSKYLRYANFSISPEIYVGFSLLYGLFLGLDIAIILYVWGFPALIALASILAAFLLFQAFLDSMVILISDARGKAVEEVLPDALQLMAANIRSGLPPDKSLLLAARPEFGPLEVEIRSAAKRTISGKPFDESLKGVSERIDSKLLERSVNMIIEGIRKGGELASLLEQTAEDIRHAKILLKEVSAYVLMYVIFIFFAGAMVAPLLYATSTYLVETMGKIGGMMPGAEVPTAKQVGTLKITRVQLSVEFLQIYSLSALTITSVFGGLIIGLIRDGHEKAGIKFIPIFFILSMGIFFIGKNLISSFLAISV